MKGSSSIGESDSSAGVDQVTHIFATICRPDCLHNNKEINSPGLYLCQNHGHFLSRTININIIKSNYNNISLRILSTLNVIFDWPGSEERWRSQCTECLYLLLVINVQQTASDMSIRHCRFLYLLYHVGRSVRGYIIFATINTQLPHQK